MTELTVYHLKTCDTCRKAVKALMAAGHALTTIDVRADGMPTGVLQQTVDTLGWEAVLNRRSTTWRTLSDDQKSDMDAGKAVALMAAHPTLIKRPVIIGPDQTTVGFAKAQHAVWL